MNFSSEFAKLLSKLEPAIDRGVQRVAEEIQHRAETSTLFKGVTGELRKNIKVLPAGFMARVVLADRDYAFYTEWGNDHHGSYIYPKGKVLHFTANGSSVFATRVRSYSGKHFLREAARASEPNVARLLGQEIAKVL